jgi:hypothetical protein
LLTIFRWLADDHRKLAGMYGGRTEGRYAPQLLAAACVAVFGLEVVAAAWRPFAGWIPKLQIGLAVAYALFIYSLARSRIPRAVRARGGLLKLTVDCICARHERCGDHFVCPCECHDHYLHRMMRTWPAPVPASIGMRNP